MELPWAPQCLTQEWALSKILWIQPNDIPTQIPLASCSIFNACIVSFKLHNHLSQHDSFAKCNYCCL